MGLAHRERPLYGVQFHPKASRRSDGHSLLQNFLDLAAQAAVPHERARFQTLSLSRLAAGERLSEAESAPPSTS